MLRHGSYPLLRDGGTVLDKILFLLRDKRLLRILRPFLQLLVRRHFLREVRGLVVEAATQREQLPFHFGCLRITLLRSRHRPFTHFLHCFHAVAQRICLRSAHPRIFYADCRVRYVLATNFQATFRPLQDSPDLIPRFHCQSTALGRHEDYKNRLANVQLHQSIGTPRNSRHTAWGWLPIRREW